LKTQSHYMDSGLYGFDMQCLNLLEIAQT
jgi:hypothetical protein